MPSEHFERKLREKLGQVEVPPRPEVWETLQAQLQPPPTRRRGTTLLWFGAMALSTAAAITLLWLFWPGPDAPAAQPPPYAQTHKATPPVAAPSSPATILPPASATGASPDRLIPEAPAAATSPPASSPTPSHAVAASPAPLVVSPLAQVKGPQLHQPILNQPGPFVDRPLPAIEALAALETPASQPHWENLPPLEVPLPETRQRGWSFRLSAGSARQRSGSDLGLMAMNNSGSSSIRADYVNVTGGQTLFGDLPAENLQSISLPQALFNASVRLEYRLDRSWSLESGLGVTVFETGTAQSIWFAPGSSTDFENLSGPVEPSELSVQTSTSQTFQPLQLEVPLYLNRYLPAPGRGQVLLSAGLSLNGSLYPAATNQKALMSETNSDRAFNPGGNLVVTPTFDPGTAQAPPASEALLSLRRFHSHAALRLLYQLPLGGRYAFFLGPEVRYQLSPMYSGPAASVVEPYHLGFQLGLRL